MRHGVLRGLIHNRREIFPPREIKLNKVAARTHAFRTDAIVCPSDLDGRGRPSYIGRDLFARRFLRFVVRNVIGRSQPTHLAGGE